MPQLSVGTRAGTPQNPPNKERLDGQTSPPEPRSDRNRSRFAWICRHVQVGRKDGDQERDESPRGHLPGRSKEQAHAPENLKDSADLDHLRVPGNVRRHDSQVGFGLDEVEESGADVEDGGKDQCDLPTGR